MFSIFMSLNWILECVQIYYCKFSHLYNGPYDSITVNNYEDSVVMLRWCVEACSELMTCEDYI